jgi:branched-subunit amino acid ABC-type transport system permease component
MSTVVTIVLFGAYTGSLLSIGAVGFTMQFGITNVLNLAYGAVLTGAMYGVYYVAGGGANIWLALIIGAVSGSLISLVLGRGIVASYVKRGTTLFGMAMVTIALSLVMEFGLQAIQGPGDYSFTVSQSSGITIDGVSLSALQLTVIGCAVVTMVAIHALLRYTTLGLAMRATASDPALSRACGVPTTRIRTAAWVISGALCGVSGVLLGVSTGAFNSSTGGGFFITLVAAAIIGGVGQPYGAMVGALIVGVASEAAAALIDPSYKDIVAWAILILVLLLRPQGLFAEFASGRELVG